MATIRITLNAPDPEIREILIAELNEAGFEGFEEREDTGLLLAYIPEKNWKPAILEQSLAPWSLTYTVEKIAEKNWNEEWEKSFDPVRVGDFCGIRAAFHPSLPGVLHEIIITPKMSFGTGHHATTYMMIETMQGLDFKDRTVLDFGTGTGVLAILAAKMGAREVEAIDHDEWCIINSLENIAGNGVTGISVKKKDTSDAAGSFDLILANINKNVILKELHFMRQHLSEDGVLVLSGLLEEDLEEIQKAAAAQKFYIMQKTTRSRWLCLQLKKR